MRFCFDVDGTIAELKKEGEQYQDVLPKKGAVETLKKLREDGHYIILHTARNMQTYSGHVGKVISVQSPILFEWLKKYDVPYDEVYFGKPSADFYVDDKAIRMNEWEDFEWKNLM